jgi:hypothetical protein
MKSLWRIARKSMLLWFGAAFFSVGLIIFLIGAKGLIEERWYPDESRSVEAGNSPVVAMVLGGLFAIVGGFFFFRTAAHVGNQWSILRAGDATQGTVIAIDPSGAEINNVRLWEVRYRYLDHFGQIHEGTSGDVTPSEAHGIAMGDNVNVRFDRDHPEQSVWDRPELSALTHNVASPAQIEPRQSIWPQLKGFLTMLALAFAVIITGEIVMPITGLDGFIADHETLFLLTAIGTTAVGFVLFMGGILYRIFGGTSAPMSRADVEDHLRNVAFKTRPYLVRASMYRFKGKSAGSSFHDQFSIKEAKDAWKQRAWRTSVRWRGNFVIMGGVLLFATGLFSIFVVIGANGIRFLCGAAILYAVVRTFIAFARA